MYVCIYIYIYMHTYIIESPGENLTIAWGDGTSEISTGGELPSIERSSYLRKSCEAKNKLPVVCRFTTTNRNNTSELLSLQNLEGFEA